MFVEVALAGEIKCPICHTLWFRGVNQQLMYVLLRKNWQARKAEYMKEAEGETPVSQ
jgi:hypothetical protein